MANQVEKGNIVVAYYPTEEMAVGYMIKLCFQGKLFVKFCKCIMGVLS